MSTLNFKEGQEVHTMYLNGESRKDLVNNNEMYLSQNL